MWSTARHVAAGDVVIIWLTRDLIQPIIVTPGKDFNSRYGNYRHADFVGVPYGSKVASKTGKGFLHILRPTPELWTIALPHRTQILYIADIAFIISYLNISRGSRVIEAGTGSASFSHSVARTIGPSGHLFSYEFHEVRAQKAREEFERHGMNEIVSLEHRNVCKDGFTVVNQVDAVFLDLPAPWEAVEHAKKALRKDRITRICCFSPCMEQVLRTVSALNESGFTEITMYETLQRPIEVSSIPKLQSVGEASELLKKAEQKREEKRLRQIAANKAAASALKRKREKSPTPTPTTMTTTTMATMIARPRPGSGPGLVMEFDHHDGGANTLGKGGNKRMKTEAVDIDVDDVDVDVDIDDRNGGGGGGETTMEILDSISGVIVPPPPSSGCIKIEDIENEVVLEDEGVVEQERLSYNNTSSSSPQQTTTTTPTNLAATSTGTSASASAPLTKTVVSKALPEVRGHTSYLTFACLIPYP